MGELNALGRTSDTKRTLLITTKTLPFRQPCDDFTVLWSLEDREKIFSK
jgi:hypothetical protein